MKNFSNQAGLVSLDKAIIEFLGAEDPLAINQLFYARDRNQSPGISLQNSLKLFCDLYIGTGVGTRGIENRASDGKITPVGGQSTVLSLNNLD